MHSRYHPLFDRILGIVRSGTLGRLRHVEGRFTTSIPDRSDLRHNFETAGGATMDLGCYPLHWLRQVVGEEPRVVTARAREGNPNVDITMTAELEFPSRTTGRMLCSMAEGETFATSLEIIGERGTLFADNPMAPQLGHRVTVRTGGETMTIETVAATSYRHQLVAFVEAVRTGRVLPTGGADAVANMQLIDAVYRAAGLPVRGTEPGTLS
jgi:predicted dehydrogenase